MELKNNKMIPKGSPKEKKPVKKKEAGSRKIFRTIIASFIILVSAGLGMLAATFGNVLDIYNQNNDKKISFSSINGIKEAYGEIKEITSPLETPVNLLLLGSDISYDGRGRSVDTGPTRSDTMMLAHIDPGKNEVGILSIPRDTRVLIPEHNYYDKINSAYAYGGEMLARKTVANLTGAPVHHYVSLKVNGLMNIVDILGGVDIDVEKDMHYIDNTAKLNINLKKGRQTLNGQQAHGYVRFRHDEIGDIGRVQRQQRFVNAVAEKLLSPSTIVKLPELVNEVQKNIVTDLTNTEMLKIGYFLKGLKKEQIKMVMLPGSFGNIRGASYWIIDEPNAREVISDLFPDSVYATQPQINPAAQIALPADQQGLVEKRKYRLTILNGTVEPRLAAKAARAFRDDGWPVWSVSESKNKLFRTQIIVQTGKSKAVPSLVQTSGVNPEIINSSIGDIYTDFTIIVGNDFATYLKKKQDAMDIGTQKLQERK
jgi:LCP family protein required for cell wall assembly